MNKELKFLLIAISISSSLLCMALIMDSNREPVQILGFETEVIEEIQPDEESVRLELYEENVEKAKKLADEINKNSKLNSEDVLKEYQRLQETLKQQENELNQAKIRGEVKIAEALALTTAEAVEITHYASGTSSVKTDFSEYTEFRATGYDLSYQSCNKYKTDPQYGITAAGIDLKGKTREDAMLVAVDPSIIPLGSKLEVIFKDKAYENYNGTYVAGDTGSAVKGNKIDLFLGDFDSSEPHTKTNGFGITDVYVKILK